MEKINLILHHYCLITQSAMFDLSLSCSTFFQFVALGYNINVPLHKAGWQSHCVESQLSVHADPEHIECAVYEKLCKMYKTKICRKFEMVDVLIIFTVECVIKYNNNNNDNNIHRSIYLWHFLSQTTPFTSPKTSIRNARLSCVRLDCSIDVFFALHSSRIFHRYIT